MENTCSCYLFLFLLSLSTSPPLPVEATRERLRKVDVSSWGISFQGPHDFDTSSLDNKCSFFAVARNELDVSRLSDICNKEGNEHCWVGLRKRTNNEWRWLYPDKKTSLPVSAWPDSNMDDLGCGTIQGNMLHDYKCDTSLNALCQYNYLVLVREEKTWDEALQHCRDYRRDLLSLHDKDELTFTLDELAWTQTEEVWIGLHWLAGRWMWLQRAASGIISLPAECPADGTHCGSLSEQGQHARSCVVKRSFFCR